MRKKSKVGIIVNDLAKLKAYHPLINRSMSSDAYEITHLIVLNPARTGSAGFKSLFKFIQASSLIQSVEKFIFNILFRSEAFFLWPITRKKSP